MRARMAFGGASPGRIGMRGQAASGRLGANGGRGRGPRAIANRGTQRSQSDPPISAAIRLTSCLFSTVRRAKIRCRSELEPAHRIDKGLIKIAFLQETHGSGVRFWKYSPDVSGNHAAGSRLGWDGPKKTLIGGVQVKGYTRSQV